MSARVRFRSASPRRRAAVLFLVVVVLGLTVGGAVWALGSRPSPDAPAGTAWERVLDQIGPDGEVSFETALAAFSLAVGPLPGVPMPAGPVAPIASGTGAIRWLQGYRSRLTDEQRAAVDRYLAPDPNAIRVEPATSAVRMVFASYSGSGSGRAAPVAAELTLQEQQFLRWLDDARGEIARLLGRKLNLRYTFAINKTDATSDLAYTLPHFGYRDFFAPSECEFRVNPSMFDKGYGDVEFKASMAHEMFHCFQVAKMSGHDQWTSTLKSRPWLIEGSAEWVGETVAGPSMIGLIPWNNYLKTPEQELFARAYRAFGFYLHMVERGVNPWLHLDKMMYADNLTAYHEAADPGGDAFLDTWASGHFGERQLGLWWVAAGPWSTTVHADILPFNVPLGGELHVSAIPFTGTDIRVSARDAEIIQVQAKGHVRMADGADFDAVVTLPLLLCVAGNACVCPPGMKDTGPAFITVTQPLALALTGAVDGATAELRGEKFEERCDPDPTPSPRTSGRPPVPGGQGRPRCGTRCPGSNGEPHIRTVDGTQYGFQAAGEFTLLRMPDGTLDVQIRQEPEAGVAFGSVSKNTAFAARIGGRRVGIYATATGLDLRVDGKTQTGSDVIDVGDTSVHRHAAGFEIDMADGTVIWVMSRGPYGLYALIDASPALVDGGVGLLGRSAPGLGVPRLPDGTALPAPLDRHDAYALLYQRFADAWRVTDATTLFDYDAGKTTASHTIRDYPAAPKVASFEELDASKAAAGRQACGAVSDPELRDQCAYDVAVTGDVGYVGPYITIEQLAQVGTAALDVPITPTASPQPSVSAASPPVEVISAFHRLAGSALAPDGTLYVSVVLVDGTGSVLAIDPLTGRILRQVMATGAGEVAVAAGSVWVGEFTGTAGTAPCSVSRLDLATLAVQATIPTACHRVWLRTNFAAVGKDLWFVDPSGADASGTGGSLRRIDSATNTVSESAALLPFSDGIVRASATALFYGESTKGQFRLRPDEPALSRIGTPGTDAFPNGYPSGDGLWAVVGGQLALYTSADGPAGTIDLNDADGGILVAADAQGVYVERSAGGGSTALWRRYLDGRLPVRLAVVPRSADSGIGPVPLSYADVALFPTFLVGQTSVAKLWVEVSRSDPTQSLLLVQGARLPTP
jgi:hypothetical protein